MTTCKCKGYTYVTYNTFCECVEHVFDNSEIKDAGKLSKLKGVIDFLKKIYKTFQAVLSQMSLTFKDLSIAFKKKEFWNLLVLLKFEFTLVFKALGAAQKAIADGLLTQLAKISNSEIMSLVKDKVIKLDSIIQKIPVIKQLSGLALAGLLIWMWSSMTFIGDLEFDFDLSIAFEALSGKYTITHLLTTEQGLQFITLYFTGTYGGLTFNWILGAPYCIVLMLVYTVVKKPEINSKIKEFFKNKSSKITKSGLKIPNLNFKEYKKI